MTQLKYGCNLIPHHLTHEQVPHQTQVYRPDISPMNTTTGREWLMQLALICLQSVDKRLFY